MRPLRLRSSLLPILFVVLLACGLAACGDDSKTVSGKVESASKSKDDDKSSKDEEKDGADADSELGDDTAASESDGSDEDTAVEDDPEQAVIDSLAELPEPGEDDVNKPLHTVAASLETPESWARVQAWSEASSGWGENGAIAYAAYTTTDDVDEVWSFIDENWLPRFKKLGYAETSETQPGGFDLLYQMGEEGHKYIGARKGLNSYDDAPLRLMVRRVDQDETFVQDVLESGELSLAGFSTDANTLYRMPYTEIQLYVAGLGQEKGG